MDFIDDEANSSPDDDVLVPSSQTCENPPARKRRRISRRHNSLADSDGGDDYELPSNQRGRSTDDEGDGKENYKTKYEDRIHIPEFPDCQPDTFVTQLTQQFSSPSRIRGARWMKPRECPTPSLSRPREVSFPMSPNQPALVDESLDGFAEDEDDAALLQAFDAAVCAPRTVVDPRQPITGTTLSGTSVLRASIQRSTSFRQTTLHGVHTTQREAPTAQTQPRTHNWPLASRNETPTHHDTDQDAMSTWVYPTNLGRIRDYQYNIVHKGLFHNVLVALPTGLGKTFIAATIMLNWFRWTKSAQIVFVAPTKPLVSQQIDACFNIVGIPRSQTTMLTGEISPAIRAEEWQDKRVFFLTPQTLVNDLKNGMCDPKRIVLVVVDEAHKATGNYAYVEVVKFLRRYNPSFRVLALTATPGATVEAVQEVIDGLGIARVEIRTEDSLDIRDFVHSRNTEIELFDNSDEITMSLELFSSALQPLMNKLHSQNAYWGKDPERITLYGLKKALDQWKASEAGRKASFGIKGMVQGIFAVLMSLAHNLELLKYHGIGPFYHKMKSFADEAFAGGRKYAKQVADDENFKKLMNRLRGWINNPEFIGHPKLTYLKTVVLNHFMDAGQGVGDTAPASNTRIMIFAHYRDSAEEIARVLNRHGPMIRAHVFVGQSGTKGSEGMDQKTQLDIIKKFKAGTYNTIVATSIGEEGLDIGEVDLIVCYDCSKSPIRMLQRMGRTGRKRAGNIVLLLMRGKEESDYYKAKDNYQKMQAKIESGKEFKFHEDLSPRIVPREVAPAVDKCVVDIPVENTQPGSVEPKRRKPKTAKKPAKKFHMPDGVETGFTFLGNGKMKKSKDRPKENVKSSTAKKDHELAPLPSLDGVLLSEVEEHELEDRYIRLAGMKDEFIQYVRFDAFPEEQRRLGTTGNVKHSRVTKSLVGAFKAMRNQDQDWTCPPGCGEVEELGANDELDSDADTREVKRRRAKRCRPVLNAQPSGTIDSGSLDQYDGNDSFIDDSEMLSDPLRTPRPRKQAPISHKKATDTPRSIPEPSLSPEGELYNRFFVSQQSIDYDAMDQDLPDLETIVKTRPNPTKVKLIKQSRAARIGTSLPNSTTMKVGRRVRRIVDSDDDDDTS